MKDFENIALQFKNFAQYECKGSSNLYELLSNCIAVNPEMLKIAAEARPGQPIPNLLFGAVNFVLRTSSADRLQDYYTADKALDDGDCFAEFRRFVLEHETKIVALLRDRRVQTNEVNRSAYLYPMISAISELQTDKPIHLIELGAAAGLNLCCDQYHYKTSSLDFGEASSTLTLECEFRNNYPYGPIKNDLQISGRVAIDLNILDMQDDDDRRWMRALIWPEHYSRIERFDQALEIVRANDLEYLQGNALSLLEDCISKVSKDVSLCVFHTHVANQMTQQERERLVALIDKIGEQRDIAHLYNNIDSADLQLVYFKNGVRTHVVIAQTEGHGRWVEWSGEPIC